MVKFRINKKEVGLENLIDIFVKLADKTAGAKTIDEIDAALRDADAGIVALKGASVDGNTIVKSALLAHIDLLRSNIGEIKKDATARRAAMLRDEAKSDADVLLKTAKKWLRWGDKRTATSFLRNYSALCRAYGLDLDSEYETLLSQSV